MHNSSNNPQAIQVFYDGDCPICRIEVDLYRKFGDGNSIVWTDIVALTDQELPKGKDRQSLLNRFQVLDNGGAWHIGVDAFARIWKQLPGFKYFAFLFSVPGLRQIAELCYRGFLKWQRWHRANKRAAQNE